MTVLVDINHPAHVHVFKNFAWAMQSRGHNVFFTTMDKEVSVDLLKAYGFNFVVLGKNRKGLGKKLIEMIKYDAGLLKYCRKVKPDILISHGSIYASVISFLIRKPHIAFEDTENAGLNNFVSHLFTKAILTPSCYRHNINSKQIRYQGNLEICYLHKNYFNPDEITRSEQDLNRKGDVILVRFVSWNATHDIGHTGISYENKLRAVREFSKYGTVLISSEKKLEGELENYRLEIPSENLHSVISKTKLVFGESATIASEAAVLGIPAIYVDNEGRGYTDEEEKFGLVFNFTESGEDQSKAIAKGVELLSENKLKEFWEQKRKFFLENKIDVTAFMVWFVENFPESFGVIKTNPEYQNRFK